MLWQIKKYKIYIVNEALSRLKVVCKWNNDYDYELV